MSMIKANKRLGVVTTQAEQMSILQWVFFSIGVWEVFLLASIVPKSVQGCALIMYRYSTLDIVTVSNVCVCVCVFVLVESVSTLCTCHLLSQRQPERDYDVNRN